MRGRPLPTTRAPGIKRSPVRWAGHPWGRREVVGTATDLRLGRPMGQGWAVDTQGKDPIPACQIGPMSGGSTIAHRLFVLF